MTGDSKKKTSGQSRLRDLDRDTDRRDNRLRVDSKDPKDRRDGDRNDEREDNRDRDPNDNSESNGLAEFNLKNFIRQQNGMTAIKDQQLPRASQLFRSEIGNTAMDARQFEKERAERDAKSAEFMQILKPRTTLGFTGPTDPVNAPDLSRREVNPVVPRSLGSSDASRSPFSGPPQSPSSRLQENAMLGVTGPSASSLAPAVSAPAPRVDATRARQIVIDPPRRIGF